MDRAFYCPNCFIQVSENDTSCPDCHTNFEAWTKSYTYEEKLIHSLKHPNSEARMSCIITLGNKGLPEAAIPLAQCALIGV